MITPEEVWSINDVMRLRTAPDEYYRDLLLRQWPAEFQPVVDDAANEADAAHGLGPTVMRQWYLNVPCFNRFNWSAQLHHFTAIDEREPFHTHQADFGLRFILFGYYVEEIKRPDGKIVVDRWAKGRSGVIRASLNHRMRDIAPEGCVSLWLRGPTRNPVTWQFPDGSSRTLSFDEMQA